jgi:hypothetical protein
VTSIAEQAGSHLAKMVQKCAKVDPIILPVTREFSTQTHFGGHESGDFCTFGTQFNCAPKCATFELVPRQRVANCGAHNFDAPSVQNYLLPVLNCSARRIRSAHFATSRARLGSVTQNPRPAPSVSPNSAAPSTSVASPPQWQAAQTLPPFPVLPANFHS